jgi:flagellar assembly protein FliH
MNLPRLEDFGGTAPASPVRAAPKPGAYDEGYAAGWEDAVSRLDARNAVVGERLAETLGTLAASHREASATVIAALEPALREIFDTLLPRIAQDAFLPVLMEEIAAITAADDRALILLVAPEEEPALIRLLDRGGLSDRVTVRAEPALALSQALIRWGGQERRIDLDGVLAALDDALEAFLAEVAPPRPGSTDTQHKEAANG